MPDRNNLLATHPAAGAVAGNEAIPDANREGRLVLDDQAAGSVLRQDETLKAWYCVHARPKHQHIAASHLRQLEDVEVFSPRIRFKRSTRQGPAWVTEALFPGYLFARFNWHALLGRVRSATGVSGVVHFGEDWPTIPVPVVEDLRRLLGDEEIRVLSTSLNPGDNVEITGGVFHGLRAVVATLLPARQRVKVLFDFLGQPTWAELPENAVIKRDSHPCLELAMAGS